MHAYNSLLGYGTWLLCLSEGLNCHQWFISTWVQQHGAFALASVKSIYKYIYLNTLFKVLIFMLLTSMNSRSTIPLFDTLQCEVYKFLKYKPLIGLTKFLLWLTVSWMYPICPSPSYPLQQSVLTVEPGSTCLWIMACRVPLSRLSTTKNIGCGGLCCNETSPTTHLVTTRRPLWYCGGNKSVD